MTVSDKIRLNKNNPKHINFWIHKDNMRTVKMFWNNKLHKLDLKNTKRIQLSRTILLCGRTLKKYLPLPATTKKKTRKTMCFSSDEKLRFKTNVQILCRSRSRIDLHHKLKTLKNHILSGWA